MLSVQRWLARNNQCFELLEASAELARSSVNSLTAIIKSWPATDSVEAFSACRERHKKVTRELTHHLCVTFVTPLEREDIAKITIALNRVSKAAEKFFERFLLAPKHVHGWNLTEEMSMLENISELAAAIVRELCRDADAARIRDINARIQKIEGEADRLLEKALKTFYEAEEDSVRWIVHKDLLEQLEKVFDRCRSVGNLTYWAFLKNL